MLREFQALLLALFVVCTTAVAQTDAVHVVSSDARELVIDVQPHVTYSRLSDGDLVPRSPIGATMNASTPGEPIDMRLIVPVALPSPGGNSVEVVSAQYSAPVTGRIAPVPTVVDGPDGYQIPSYRIDAAAYARAPASRPVAMLAYMGIAREVHAGNIRIAAYQYDPSASTIRTLESVRLRVHYGPAGPVPATQQPLSALTRTAFINAPIAAAWSIRRAPRERTLMRRSGRSTARAWLRVDVEDDGLYVLTADDFDKAGVDLASVSRIAVYGGDGGSLPEAVSEAANNQMAQVPVMIERAGDGRISRVLFYGAGPHRWIYRYSQDTIPTHELNPYVRANSYIVAVDGEDARTFSIDRPDGSPSVFPTLGVARVFHEVDNVNAIDINNNGSGSGRAWFGQQFEVFDDRASDTRVFETPLPGLDRQMPITYRIRVAHTGRRPSNSSADARGFFSVREGSVPIGDSIVIAGVPDGGYTAYARMQQYFLPDATSVGGDDRSLLSISYRSGVPAKGFLDWYEIHYYRRLQADGGSITFEAPEGNGLAEYDVGGFNSDDIIGFDITDPANPIELGRQPGASGHFVFRGSLSYTRRDARRYFITTMNEVRAPQSVRSVPFGDLREQPLNADILVITAEKLKDVAASYVDYRRSRGQSAAFVTVEQIYTEFSHGNLDPTAIRDYIAQAYSTWTRPPEYVLFYGDATYDYRGIIQEDIPLVPTYESADQTDSYNDIYSTAYDDYFTRVVGEDALVDLASGRIPASSVEEAQVVLEKIRSYEASDHFGLWRQTLLLTADDADPPDAGTDFVEQSENLWRSTMPTWMEPRKIYLPSYPKEPTSRRKPGAASDLKQFIEQGALLTNWIGHGNPNVWAHESLLEKDILIPRLSNDTMLTFVTAATCNFASFDARQVSGAEMFVTQPHGGAIAVYGATRASFIYDNKTLLNGFMRVLFQRRESTGEYPSIGEALYLVKQQGGDQTNNQKYVILGDPTVGLDLPRDSVAITSVNGVDVSSDTVVVGALSQVHVDGVVRGSDGSVRSDFNGTAIVTLYDADRNLTLDETVNGEAFHHPATFFGGRLFRGPATVTNGRFSTTFRIPKDISYDSANARMLVYAYDQSGDAAGATRNIQVFGADTVAVTDTKGPDIKLYLDDRTFSDGDVVTPAPMLIVDLKDTSGINASGAGLGHRIEAWIDGSADAIDLTDYYQTLPTTYQEGSAERRLDTLAPGLYHVRVRAWDIFNNHSESSTYFRVAEAEPGDLQVIEVVNYPNPMARETDFTFRHNQTRPLDVDVSIYTQSGRKIRDLAAHSVTDRFVRVHWDGTDADGRRVANGVYLYRLKVSVVGEEDAKTFETIDKVAVVR